MKPFPSPHFPASLVLIAALTAGLWMLAPDQPIIETDSAGYFGFAPVRTAGYPAFLWLVGAHNAVAAQLAIFGLSALALATAIDRATSKWWITAGITVLIFANPVANRFHYSVLTESLFVSCQMVTLAGLILMLESRRHRWGLSAVAAAALAVAIRPSALPMLLVAAAAMIFLDDRRWRGAALAAIVALAIIGTERTYSIARHGDALTSLAGPHLFAKAGLIDAPPSDRVGFSAVENRLADVLEREDAPVRDLLRSAQRSTAYSPLLSYYELCLQWSCRAQAGVGGADDDSLKKLAIDRIVKNPLGYARLTWHEYQGLWSFGTRTHPRLAVEFDRFVAANRPLPMEAFVDDITSPSAPRQVMLLARPVYLTIGLAMALSLLIGAIAHRLRYAAIAFLAAVIVQAVLIFTAMTAIGYARYTIAMWPAIIVALAFAALAITRSIRERGTVLTERSTG